MLETNYCKSENEARALVEEKINNGEALEKLREMIKYQGGDDRVIDDYNVFMQCKKVIEVKSVEEGYVCRLEALEIGLGAMLLGAGREQKEDAIDPSVGVKVLKKVGDKVEKGDTLALMYVNDKGIDEAYNKVLNAYHIQKDFVKKPDLILGLIKD